MFLGNLAPQLLKRQEDLTVFILIEKKTLPITCTMKDILNKQM